jgi:predicted small metal-binding protein
MVTKAVHCTCGVEIRNQDEAQLIRDVQKHASEAHNLTLNDEQVRAMMFIEQDRTAKS